MADLKYQTVQVENRPIVAGGPSPRGAAVGGGVKLLHKASIALNGWALSWRVNEELKKLSPQIQKLMPTGSGGVLVCVGVQEWATPDPTGNRAQTFLSLHIVGSGLTPDPILQRYIQQPRLVKGAASGWRRKDIFIWITL